MSFIAPLFFVALAALAIPVLIHLIQREKKQILRFPSLMFVQRVPYKSIQRRRIHNWLLLMVRLAALALIILAFARPFFERQDVAPIGTGAREVVVLLDQSYSIGYADRWERARGAAYDAINGLGSADRGSVVLFSSGAEIALRSTAAGERERLTAAVAAAKPTDGASDLLYSLVHNVAHTNVADMFREDKRLIPADDTLTVVRGHFGLYPNFFFEIDAAQADAFASELSAVASDAAFEQFVVRHGVRRTDPRFWATSDWLRADALRANATEAGIYDLDRYDNL